METYETLLLVVHVIAALVIIGLVLIQRGKGADMGSGFGGGSSSTVFGSGGAGSFLTRLTTGIAIAFFMTSFGLAFFAKEKSNSVTELGMPAVVEQTADEVSEADETGEASVATPAEPSEIPSLEPMPGDSVPDDGAGSEIPEL